jgi:ABC-type spermidine/putrescine transport system permease subunit II
MIINFKWNYKIIIITKLIMPIKTCIEYSMNMQKFYYVFPKLLSNLLKLSITVTRLNYNYNYY